MDLHTVEAGILHSAGTLAEVVYRVLDLLPGHLPWLDKGHLVTDRRGPDRLLPDELRIRLAAPVVQLRNDLGSVLVDHRNDFSKILDDLVPIHHRLHGIGMSELIHVIVARKDQGRASPGQPLIGTQIRVGYAAVFRTEAFHRGGAHKAVPQLHIADLAGLE